MKTNLDHTINSYFDELKNYANKISPGFDIEHIHHFRTNTKKLRSILRLHGYNNKLLSRKFLKLYHIAGDLRNAQLLLYDLAEEAARLPLFFLWLATYIGNKQEAWNKHYSEAIFTHVAGKLSGLNGKECSLDDLRAFFRAYLGEVSSIVADADPEAEKLHTTRKRIKDMVYVRHWCKDSWLPGWNATRRFSLLSLKKLADVAGSYNDRRTSLDLLTAYLEQEDHVKAIKAGKIVVRNRRKAAQKTKAELIASVRGFAARFNQGKEF